MPPYILYVARAFSTLEGIGLSANDDYSIVSEAYPYLSKRLLTDDSPRAKAALRSMVYGGSDKDAANSSPDFAKFLSMGEGFTSYSSATSGVPEADKTASTTAAPKAAAPPPASSTTSTTSTTTTATAAAANAEGSEEAQDALIDLLLSTDGNYVQELLLEEAAKLTDAAVRNQIAQASTSQAAKQLADLLQAPKKLADSTVRKLPFADLGPLKAITDAALLPATVLDEVSRVLPTLAGKQETDEATLSAFGALWDEISPAEEEAQGSSATEKKDKEEEEGNSGFISLPSPELPPLLSRGVETVQTNAGPLFEQLQDPQSRLRHRLPLLGNLSRRFGALLLRRVASRIEASASAADAPGIAKPLAERAAEIDRSLADLIEPEKVETPAGGQ